jgi:hypothetical protein
MDSPSLPPRQPIRASMIPLCLQHQLCQCRNDNGIQRHFLSPRPSLPSRRPLLCASSHPMLSSRDTAGGEADEMAHWLDSVELLYAYIQNPGNSECHALLAMRLQRANGWAHHPTRDGQQLARSKNIIRVAHSFHPEATATIHHLEKVVVLLASEPA